jgi:hypothetical protein
MPNLLEPVHAQPPRTSPCPTSSNQSAPGWGGGGNERTEESCEGAKRPNILGAATSEARSRVHDRTRKRRRGERRRPRVQQTVVRNVFVPNNFGKEFYSDNFSDGSGRKSLSETIVTDTTELIQYVTKYATKPEKDTKGAVADLSAALRVNQTQRPDRNQAQALSSAVLKTFNNRALCPLEMFHYIYSRPFTKTNVSVHSINLRASKKLDVDGIQHARRQPAEIGAPVLVPTIMTSVDANKLTRVTFISYFALAIS